LHLLCIASLTQRTAAVAQTLNVHHVTLFDARTPLMNCARARGVAAAAITCARAALRACCIHRMC
jgi:hypothetical protein